MTEAVPLVEALDLACLRGGRLVLEAVAFALASGDALLLRGPNGSGKSTLLRLLAGFLRPTLGEVRIGGVPLDRLPEGPGSRLHYVGHLNAVKPLLTVEENLNAAIGLAGGGDAGPGLGALDLVPLKATPARFLSAGQKRRLALARLAAIPRPLWLLDEPGVGLDRRSRKGLEALIRAHRRGGGAVVAATHGDVRLDDAYALDLDG
ncbi:MAG: heme ABC exporter ATP-binding protein CcmA [Geminicoccaceae bacterium]|nr:heme ABC exporter ATP-binding protein CcmA [Geminicoccaceae bacterium]